MNAGASRAHSQMSQRRYLVVSVVLGLMLGTLWLLVTLPPHLHLRSLQDGMRADATLVKNGLCMLGRCQVEFEADGRRVVADLPVGSSGGKSSVGDRLTVRYEADDAQVVALEDDVDGATAMAVMSGGIALFFPVAMAIFLARQRQALMQDGTFTPELRLPE